jgi:hypothetical protein
MHIKRFRSLGFLPLLGLGISLALLKGCSAEKEVPESRFTGVSIPFYRTTTLTLPTKAKQQPDAGQQQKVLYQSHLRILRKLLKGELTGYERKNLSSAYSASKLQSRAKVEGYQASDETLDNDAFRRNFIRNIDQRRFHAYRVTLEWDWDPDQQQGEVRIHSLTPYYRPSVGGESLGAQPLASVSYKAVQEQLKPSLSASLEQVLRESLFRRIQTSRAKSGNLAYQAERKDSPAYVAKRSLPLRSDSGIAGGLSRQFEHIHRSLLSGARAGELPVFRTDSLEQAFASAEAVRRQGASREVVEIVKESEDGRYYADTTIYNAVRPSRVKQYWVLEEWNQVGPGTYQLKPMAFAPVYQPVRGGVTLPGTSLFWFRNDELSRVLSGKALSWLRAYGFLSVQRQLSGTAFQLYRQQP